MTIYRVPRPFSFPLWRESTFLSLAFMTIGGKPTLGLLFKNADGARKLFQHFHAVLGPRDEQNLLRVALIFGSTPNMPTGYFFRLGPNGAKVQEQAAAAVSSGKYSEVDLDIEALNTMTRHMPTANPKSPHMTAFLEAYQQTGVFGIGALTLENSAPVPVSGADPLLKRELVVRDVADIKPGDEDAAVLEMSSR